MAVNTLQGNNVNFEVYFLWVSAFITYIAMQSTQFLATILKWKNQ